jgi:hypothetical protein
MSQRPGAGVRGGQKLRRRRRCSGFEEEQAATAMPAGSKASTQWTMGRRLRARRGPSSVWSGSTTASGEASIRCGGSRGAFGVAATVP